MKLKSFFNQYGFSAIPRLAKAILRRIGVITETFFLLKYELNDVEINRKFKKFDYSDIKEITEKDITKIEFLGAEKLNIYRKRFLDGNYSCYAIVIDNEVQYLTWISWKYMNYPTFFEKRELLTSSQALLEDSFCHPNYRGKGYHSKMNIFRLKKILDKGKLEVLALVLKENKPALKVQLKSGFKYYSQIKFIKIGKWSKTYQNLIK